MRIAIVVFVGGVIACAQPAPPPAPAVKVPPALPLSNEDRAILRGSSPDVSRAVQKLLVAERRARARGEMESAAALGMAIDRLLASSQDLERSQRQWNRCVENEESLNELITSMIRSEQEREQAPPPTSSRPKSRSSSSTSASNGTSDDDQELAPRIRKLAKNLERIEENPTGPAPKVRIETVRQIVLDANRAATKGLYAEAGRLIDRGEKLLDPSLKRKTMTRDEALKEDVKRIMGKRVTLADDGVLVRVADRGEAPNEAVIKRLGELLRVYTVNPVTRVGTEPSGAPAAQAVEALLKADRSSARKAIETQPQQQDLDGVWLWIGYSG